jgi:hypothetical protein
MTKPERYDEWSKERQQGYFRGLAAGRVEAYSQLEKEIKGLKQSIEVFTLESDFYDRGYKTALDKVLQIIKAKRNETNTK